MFCIFKTLDGTIWRIKFYPHGHTSPDDCSIYLECVKYASNQQIGVCYSFNIGEVDWCYDAGYTFKNDGRSIGLKEAFKAEQLNNLERMSIQCFVSETMDVGDDNTYFEWKVNRHWMQRWKNVQCKHVFRSPLFKAIGAEWKLRIYPNGWSTKGEAELEIYCESIESDQNEIQFSHFIDIQSMNHHQTHLDGNSIKKGKYVTCNSPFKLNDIRNQSEMTICVKIWKTGSIEKNEARLVSNICSKEKIMKIRKECSREQRANEETIGKLKTEIASLKHENETLAMRDTKKEQEIIQLREETEDLQNSVAMREIKTFDVMKEVAIDKEIIETQNALDDQMRLDEARLNEWKLASEKIENELKSEEKEKDLENVNETSQHLLNRFVELTTLCEKQQMRMENVVMHCTQLNAIKKILKNERKRCTEMVHKMDKDCQDLNVKHKTLQAKRKRLQMQWEDALETMNECIDEENKTNDAKCCAQNQYNRSDLEAQKWNVLRTKCVKLIKNYRLFDAQNAQNMQQMMRMFDGLWNEFMKQWFEWTPKDIICWFKYLTIQKELNLSDEFDFDSVLNEMIQSKMNGLSLAKIDKLDLKTIGVMSLNDRHQIFHKIIALMAKYPHQSSDQHATESFEGQSAMNNIPSEFVCPLTKQIMREPAKVFDNHTYEKEAIEKYLKEHNKSPITGEECEDEDDHWTLPDRKLKERIQIFVSVNNISLDSIYDNQLNQTQFIK